ncbi:hypothetical protein ACIPWF_21780 [Paenarthrobacter sp. NPDC089989]|uniref:hypothetical protein n=1 Tax=unclassified Paenarthrobacter TaxID=2634190 RepID=UPI0037F61651
MRLTVKTRQAKDNKMDLQVVELPELDVQAKKLREVSDVVKDAAAALTRRSREEFDVELGY